MEHRVPEECVPPLDFLGVVAEEEPRQRFGNRFVEAAQLSKDLLALGLFHMI
jgi:hypothetical protein